MSDSLGALMKEVLRLTRAGRLHEATSALQQALAGDTPDAARPVATARATPAAAPTQGAQDTEVIDIEARVLDDGLPARVVDAEEAAEPADANAADAAESFRSDTFSSEAGSRPYMLYIPPGKPAEPLPLVVMLHGCNQNPQDFAAGTQMNALARTLPCYVLYPGQAASANGAGCWNWFQPADQRRGLGEPAIIAGLTRQVMADHRIDPRRVYIAGLSAGGAMAATLAANYPDLYAAVGVHSGLPHAAAHDMMSALAAMRQGPEPPARRRTAAKVPGTPLQAVPVIVFHGDQDTTVNPCNGDRVIGQAQPEAALMATPSAVGWISPTTVAHQGTPPPTITETRGQRPGGHAWTRTTYRQGDHPPYAEHWVIHGAAHAWSGGSPVGSFTDPLGPDASAAMLQFFAQHRR